MSKIKSSVVEGEISTSELTSGYKAKYAKDSTGEMLWKDGVVAKQVDNARKYTYQDGLSLQEC